MELVRSWVRWTSTALGASLLVPAAVMIVAAGVALGGGGMGGLGALGQLIEGPRDPLAAVRALDPADPTLVADPPAIIAAVPADSSSPDGIGGGDVGGPGTGAPRDGEDGADRGGGGEDSPRDGTPGGEDSPRDGTPGGGDNPAGGTPGGDDGGNAPDRPPAHGDPPPGPLAPVQEGSEPVVGQLPEPVGPLSGDVIDEMVELGEQMLGSPDGGEPPGGGTPCPLCLTPPSRPPR